MGQNEIFKDGAVKKGNSLITGVTSIFSSFSILSEHKGLWRYFIIPFFINILVLTAIFYLSYSSLKPWVEGFLQGDVWYMSVLRFLVGPVLLALLAISTIFIYSIAGSIVTAPFNDIISLKVEEKLTGADFNEKFSISDFISDIIRVALNAVKLIFLIIFINLLLIIVNLLPVAGSVIYAILSFMVTAFFLGFQFFDFPLERRRLSFRNKLSVTLRYKLMVTGLGTGFFIISIIPILGYMGLNVATIGATSLFIEYIEPAMKK